jgi:hypothetical protein
MDAKAMAKSKEHSRAVWDRIGYRSIYNQLIELNIFTKQGMGALESIKQTSFEEAIYAISISNAVN